MREIVNLLKTVSKSDSDIINRAKGKYKFPSSFVGAIKLWRRYG